MPLVPDSRKMVFTPCTGEQACGVVVLGQCVVCAERDGLIGRMAGNVVCCKGDREERDAVRKVAAWAQQDYLLSLGWWVPSARTIGPLLQHRQPMSDGSA